MNPGLISLTISSDLQRWATTELLSDTDALLTSSFPIALVNGISYRHSMDYILMVPYSTILIYIHITASPLPSSFYFLIYHLLGKFRHLPLTQGRTLIFPHLLGSPITEFASSSGVFVRELDVYSNKVCQVSEFLFILCCVPALLINHN